MYFADLDQTIGAISEMGFELDSIKMATSSHPQIPEDSIRLDMSVDFESGYIAAKKAVDHIGKFTSCLLYIHSMGGRLPLENGHLYDRLRRSYGETRPNHIAPGHFFWSYDVFDLISFCELVVNYRYEAVLIQHSSRSWVAFARDEGMYMIPEGRTGR